MALGKSRTQSALAVVLRSTGTRERVAGRGLFQPIRYCPLDYSPTSVLAKQSRILE
jgi:hypothetical protein